MPSAEAVLVVEDEPAIADLVSIHLRHAGFEVILAASGPQAQAAVDAALPRMVVLDWMLSGPVTGLQLARQWRTAQRTRDLPIIMLTARGSESDMVAGLDAGADDYLAKPFSPKTLLARVKAVLRRRSPQALQEAVQIGPLVLNPATHRVGLVSTTGSGHGEGSVSSASELDAPTSVDAGQALKIGPTEFKLLHFLMTHPERVHSRAQLLDKVWGDHVYIEERTVDVHVKRLRDALAVVGCDGLVETVRGAGYRMAQPSTGPQRA